MVLLVRLHYEYQSDSLLVLFNSEISLIGAFSLNDRKSYELARCSLDVLTRADHIDERQWR